MVENGACPHCGKHPQDGLALAWEGIATIEPDHPDIRSKHHGTRASRCINTQPCMWLGAMAPKNWTARAPFVDEQVLWAANKDPTLYQQSRHLPIGVRGAII